MEKSNTPHALPMGELAKCYASYLGAECSLIRQGKVIHSGKLESVKYLPDGGHIQIQLGGHYQALVSNKPQSDRLVFKLKEIVNITDDDFKAVALQYFSLEADEVVSVVLQELAPRMYLKDKSFIQIHPDTMSFNRFDLVRRIEGYQLTELRDCLRPRYDVGFGKYHSLSLLNLRDDAE